MARFQESTAFVSKTLSSYSNPCYNNAHLASVRQCLTWRAHRLEETRDMVWRRRRPFWGMLMHSPNSTTYVHFVYQRRASQFLVLPSVLACRTLHYCLHMPPPQGRWRVMHVLWATWHGPSSSCYLCLKPECPRLTLPMESAVFMMSKPPA